MTPRTRLTLRDLSTSIATRVRLAAEAVAIGELGMAERLIDVAREEMAEMERRVKGGRKG